MADRGIKVFTVAVVGRECEAQGVLKTQSIRNAAGADFRLLIEAFARLEGGDTKHVPKPRLSPLDEAIACISDFETRNRLKAIIAENAACRADNARLRSAFSKLQMPLPQTAVEIASEAATAEIDIIPPSPRISIGPLERFLSAEWVDGLAWTISEAGTIVDGGRALTPPGFIPALRAVIEFVRGAQGRQSPQ